MTAYTTWFDDAKHQAVGGILHLRSKEVDLGGTTAADTFDLFDLPNGSMVLSVAVEITESAGETCTIDIGVTGGDVDGFVNEINMNQTAGTVDVSGAAGALMGTQLFAETMVSILTVTGTTYAAGKCVVYMVVASAANAKA